MKKIATGIFVPLLFVIAFFIGFNVTDTPDDAPQSTQKPAKSPIKKIQSNDKVSYKIGDKAIQQLEKKYGDLLYEGNSSTSYESTSFSSKLKNVITFKVKNDKLSVKKSSTNAAFDSVIVDTQLQQQLWGNFTEIIPAENRQMIVQFEIMTDGLDGTLGYVQQLSTPNQWALALDYKDASNLNGLYATIVHEYGHLFSLNQYEIASSTTKGCKTYAIDEGCLKKSSYLNAFYNEFWRDSTIKDWKAEENIEGDQDVQSTFFAIHEDEFVSEYATSHPVEDFAESWMYFVLSEKPISYNIADEKTLFFYQYPELVNLRNKIVTNLVKHY